MGGSNNSSSKAVKQTLRYAPYIESHHGAMLDTVYDYRVLLVDSSPYVGYVPIDVDSAFLGFGYTLSNFPSLYDMFGKCMAGLDLETLWSSLFRTHLNHAEINTTVASEIALVDDQVEVIDIPQFKVAMRDINAVVSSTFVIGTSQIEVARTKSLAAFSAEQKMQIIPLLINQYRNYLEWEKRLLLDYGNLLKLYYLVREDVDEASTIFDAKDKLWPLNVLDFERAALGALQRARYMKQSLQRHRSNISKALLVSSYAVQGASIGFTYGGGWYGAAVGAVIGTAVGLAIVFTEEGQSPLQAMFNANLLVSALVIGEPVTQLLVWNYVM